MTILSNAALIYAKNLVSSCSLQMVRNMLFGITKGLFRARAYR
jgi:hypothetical protein